MTNDTAPNGLFVGNDLRDIQKSLFNDLNLTEKQFFSFYMYSNGFSDKQTAIMDNTTADNIKYHLSVITRKLECNSRAELRVIYLNRIIAAQMRMFARFSTAEIAKLN